MYQQHSSSFIKPHAYVSPQPPKPEDEKDGHSSTSVKRERTSVNYFNQPPICHTPPKLHPHPPNWDKITWAPKVCRKAVRRMDFGEIPTAAH
uniref:Uncharacterized protein n=1 Tax=Panagrolaimus sp. PS1159 TaxID=55785 RepID=A0AC35G0D2_9BILA